jgi:uncharacterized protein (TIGR04255 family)
LPDVPSLPSFRHPPVTEVVLAASFKPLVELQTVHFGQLWQEKLQRVFPHTEEQPPYDPPVERFESPPTSTLNFGLFNRPPSPRIWFLSEDRQQVIQLQRDWFGVNWRKLSQDTEYERYPSVRAEFERWYGVLGEFLNQRHLGEVFPQQCEITYVNHIDSGTSWRSHGEAAKVFSFLRDLPPGSRLGEPQQAQFTCSFLMQSEGGPIGRLHAEARPAFRLEDGAPIFLLNLTARGKPQGKGVEGVLRFLDLGREWIVRGFAELTTEAMHREWGRYA